MKYYYYIDDQKHLIGEGAIGWAFSLVINKFPNLQAWKEAFRVPDAIIKNADFEIISPDDMETIITLRKGSLGLIRAFVPQFGSRAFHGPHDLMCMTVGENISGFICVANEGCWDLVT